MQRTNHPQSAEHVISQVLGRWANALTSIYQQYTIPFLTFVSLILLHLFIAPYTKVEESFNTQAIHDILYHQIPTKNAVDTFRNTYDHFLFPGSVPRTFVGALITSGLASPWIGSLKSSFDAQLLTRSILGIYNAVALSAFKGAVDVAFGKTAGMWYTLLQASQFHILFYASRPLPNMFAFGITTWAFRFLLQGHGTSDQAHTLKSYRTAIYFLSFAGVVFRAEIAAYLLTTVLYLLYTRGTSFAHLKSIITAGLTGSLIGLFLTISIDSYFWQAFPLWPEFMGFYYNTILGKSSDWGTSPFHFYFTSALPKLLFNPLASFVLIPLTHFIPAIRKRCFDILIPGHAFMALYSILPHKEWRFIVYYIPPLTAVAAAGASWIWTRRTKSTIYALLSLALVASTALSFVAATAMLFVSSLNYPGGVAMARLHDLVHTDMAINGTIPQVNIHLDNLACQTGITRFLQDRSGIYNFANVTAHVSAIGDAKSMWVYDKTGEEDELLRPEFWLQFDYALAEKPERAIGKWEILETVNGYAGVRVVRPGDEVGRIEWCAVWSPACEVLDYFTRIGRIGTRGWWVKVKMEPRIHILRQVKP